MIKFKEFIGEMAVFDPDTGNANQRKNWLTSKFEKKVWHKDTEKIGETDEHTIHKISKGADDEGHSVTYYAQHKQTGKTHATINGHEKDNAIHIDSMSTDPESSMRMHHFIHHLVHQHGKMVGASHFSPGGKKVMDRVGAMDGVKVSHWKDRHEVKTDNAYSDTHDTPEHNRTYVVAQKK